MLLWKSFHSTNPYPEGNQASAFTRVTKSHSLGYRAGGSIVPTQKNEDERRESYGLVDLKEIHAQHRARDSEQLSMERTVIHKSLSHSAVLTMIDISVFLTILH